MMSLEDEILLSIRSGPVQSGLGLGDRIAGVATRREVGDAILALLTRRKARVTACGDVEVAE